MQVVLAAAILVMGSVIGGSDSQTNSQAKREDLKMTLSGEPCGDVGVGINSVAILEAVSKVRAKLDSQPQRLALFDRAQAAWQELGAAEYEFMKSEHDRNHHQAADRYCYCKRNDQMVKKRVEELTILLERLDDGACVPLVEKLP